MKSSITNYSFLLEKKKTASSFYNDKMDIHFKRDENGTIREHEIFKKDKHGYLKPVLSYTLNEKGQMHGTYELLHKKGGIKELRNYEHGLEHGVRESFTEHRKDQVVHSTQTYFWQGQEVSRLTYWFNKNRDDLRSINPIKMIRALFKTNEILTENNWEKQIQPAEIKPEARIIKLSSHPDNQQASKQRPFFR